jgi:hypothetical protein
MPRTAAKVLLCISGCLAPALLVAAETAPLEPPDINAYVDVALGQSDLGAVGYDEQPTSYRLVAGFLFPVEGAWRWSAEIGYDRIGKAEEITSTTERRNINGASYDMTTTQTSTLDASALTFGARVAHDVGPLDAFLRAGILHHHSAYKDQAKISYQETLPIFPSRPDETRATRSDTDVGFAPYAALGVGYRLGTVPTVYAEYTTRDIGADWVDSVMLGVSLDF